MTTQEIREAIGIADKFNDTVFTNTQEMVNAIVVLANLAQSVLDAKVPKEKEETETCTACGGIGKSPNHPHILANICNKCSGTGKIKRNDYCQYNLALADCRLWQVQCLSELEEAMSVVLSDFAVNGQGNRNLITEFATATRNLFEGKGE